MNVFTIGFTKKNAEKFFGLLKKNNIVTLIDVRLNNVSQLAGFAKRDDLKYFSKELCSVDYLHLPDLSPTSEILKSYKNSEISWDEYEYKFLKLLELRNAESVLSEAVLDHSCFLCSEHEPDRCHRRLVVEYINRHTNLQLQIKHLM